MSCIFGFITSLSVASTVIEAPAPPTTSASSPSTPVVGWVAAHRASHHTKAWDMLKKRKRYTFSPSLF